LSIFLTFYRKLFVFTLISLGDFSLGENVWCNPFCCWVYFLPFIVSFLYLL